MTTRMDAMYMALAIEEARKAAALGEVPVGAVLVEPQADGSAPVVLAAAHNRPIGLHDPTAHAEILALRAAALAKGNYRLDGCTLYVTIEPCAMCAQALLHARVARVVYGAAEPKTGAAGSVIDVLGNPLLNHHTTVHGGVEAHTCSGLMQAFFAAQRHEARRHAVPLRDDALRTPDMRFDPIARMVPEAQGASHWTMVSDGLAAFRLHWIDWQPAAPRVDPHKPVAVALHSADAWWPQWATWAQLRTAEGQRVLLPDLIGYGGSDKPKKVNWHTVSRHADVLAAWLRSLDLAAVTLTTVAEQRPLALALQHRLPALIQSVHDDTPSQPAHWPPDWRSMPFPDAGHRAAPRAWPWPMA